MNRCTGRSFKPHPGFLIRIEFAERFMSVTIWFDEPLNFDGGKMRDTRVFRCTICTKTIMRSERLLAHSDTKTKNCVSLELQKTRSSELEANACDILPALMLRFCAGTELADRIIFDWSSSDLLAPHA